MHFVARNSTDSAYQQQGYALRPDPLVIFRQTPTTITGHGSPHLTHRRTHSGGSIKLRHHDDFELNALEADQGRERKPSVFEPLLPNKKEKTGLGDISENREDDLDSVHDCEVENCRRVVLNVAGLKFETQLKTLNRLPTTLLGNPSKRDRFWISSTNEYFFDRHRPSFPAILYYYQSGGRLKRPVEVPVDIFLEELQFFQLGDSVIDAFKLSEGLYFVDEDEDVPMPKQKAMKFVWEVFEYPGSSVVSNIVAIISVTFILTSIVTFCIETLPQFKNKDCTNVTIIREDGSTESLVKFNYMDPLFIIESTCIAWFVFEFIARSIVCPSKLKFVKNMINWIDLLSIAPYFIFQIVFFITNSCENNSRILSVLRVLRVARIFKLSRFSDGLKILAKTMQVSLKELSMFVLFLSIAVVIFAGAIYYAEAQLEDSFFTSIPDAFWWAVISMTTVGYGDVYPTGVIGKLIGSMCVLSGLLAIALPVPVIVTNFNNIYRQTTGRGNNL